MFQKQRKTVILIAFCFIKGYNNYEQKTGLLPIAYYRDHMRLLILENRIGEEQICS